MEHPALYNIKTIRLDKFNDKYDSCNNYNENLTFNYKPSKEEVYDLLVFLRPYSRFSKEIQITYYRQLKQLEK